jgi:hypothetical protein
MTAPEQVKAAPATTTTTTNAAKSIVSASPQPNAQYIVNESCLEGLRFLKDCGLLSLVDDRSPVGEGKRDIDDRLVTAWCHLQDEDGTNNNYKRVQFDENGCVISLDLGGKRLHRGFVTSNQPSKIATKVAPKFDLFKKLKTLNLAGTDISMDEISHVLLQIHSTIEVLYLGGNGLGTKGGKAIASWLSPSSSLSTSSPPPSHLVKLDLRYNDLGDEGMKFLCCDGIMQMASSSSSCKLTQLYVEGNNIGDVGVDALARLLIYQGTSISTVTSDSHKEEGERDHSGLREVYLGANKITHIGAKALASALHSNKLITKIFLEGNQIGVQGANAFSDVLEGLNGDTSLQQLYVDDNNIGKEGSKRLAKALNSRTAIGDIIDV